MPKNVKKAKARRRPAQSEAPGKTQNALSHASRRIAKAKSPMQQLAAATEEERHDLFQMLFVDNDTRKLDRALITLASISLEPTMAQVNLFYE